jgi:hypothetical protein
LLQPEVARHDRQLVTVNLSRAIGNEWAAPVALPQSTISRRAAADRHHKKRFDGSAASLPPEWLLSGQQC